MSVKKQTTHASGLFEIKATVGKTFDGKRIQKSFYGKTKPEARKKAKEYILQQEVAGRTGDTFISKDMTFADWARKWLLVYKKPNVSENTYAFTYENTVEKHLIPYFGKASLTEIKNVDVQGFFATKKNMSEGMLGKMRTSLAAIFDTAIENDLCYKNPANKVMIKSEAIKHEKHVYTAKQIEIVKNASYDKMNEVVILLETGIRRGEMLGLQWSDIDFKEGMLTVNRSIADSKITENKISIQPPKWNSSRSIPLAKMSIDIFKKMPHNGIYIFPKQNKNPQSPNTWSQKLARFMKTMPEDIPQLTAHELRHTYGTNLRRLGVDIYTIQKIMGHRDLKMTTELYVHNEIDELKKAMIKATNPLKIRTLYEKKYRKIPNNNP